MTAKKTKPVSNSFLKERITSFHIASFIGMTCLFLLLRWNTFSIPFERDEGEYAYAARLLSNNEMPYEHSFLQKPPMIVYTYMVGQFISEHSIVLPRILASLSVYFTIVLTGLIVARERNHFIGLAVMWIMVPMISLPAVFPFAANTEVFMILPMMVTFFLFMWKKGDASLLHWFIAGCSGAIACLYKPIAAPVLVFIVLLWQYELWKSTKSISALIKHTIVIVAGVAGTALLFLLPFIIHDGAKTLRECVIDYNIVYTSSDQNGYSSFFYYMSVLWRTWWIVFLLPFWLIIKRPALWWGYFGAIIISLITISRTAIGHYYILAIPFLAIASIIALDSLFTSISIFSNKGSVGAKVVVVGVIILILSSSNFRLLSLSSEELCIEAYGNQNPFIEAQLMATKLSENSKQSDNIFIAGSEPEILYYADRKSLSRFVIMYPLMIPTPAALTYQQEVIQSLQQNPPDDIIYATPQASWLTTERSPKLFMPFLEKLLSSQYKAIGGTLLNSRVWVDNPSAKDAKNFSLILFKRLQ